MTNFNGDNNSKALKTAFERAKYDIGAYRTSDIQVVDFHFAEKNLYGRVNRQLDPIIPLQEKMRMFPKDNFRCLNFVADQFKEMYIRYTNALSLSLISDNDPNLSELQVIRGWENPIDSYVAYTAKYTEGFLENVLIPNDKKVTSFEQYIRMFEEYLFKNDTNAALTFSGFIKSKNSNIFNTGIALQVAPIGFAADVTKEQQILQSENFPFFLNMANQFGFSVNKKNPSVLVCDLEHPTTKKFRDKYSMINLSTLFETYYVKTYNFDFDLLSQSLMNTYNTFVYLRPNLKEVYICNNKLKSNLYSRNTINDINYNLILLLYINIRNMEEFFPFSTSEIKSLHRTSLRLSTHSQEKAMEFIESNFRSKYNQKDGSLTYYRKKYQK